MLRDVLIRVARMGLVRARWSHEIMDETCRALQRKYADIDNAQIARLRQLLCDAVADCLVDSEAISALIPALDLPDPDDRHVLAAAILAGAQAIITTDLDDFPADKLASFNIEAKHPDAFLRDTYHIDGVLTHQAISEAAAARKNPAMTVDDLLDRLNESGLPVSASLLRR